LFSLLGALIIVGVDVAKRRHIMSQTENSSIPNLEEGLKWVGSSIIRFLFFFFLHLSLSPKHRSCSLILVGILYKAFLIGLQVPAFFVLTIITPPHKILLLFILFLFQAGDLSVF